MAKKKPIVWYLGKAINLEEGDGVPKGQMRVVEVQHDLKSLSVVFPSGVREIHSVKKLESFASRHGGWVDATENVCRPHDPFESEPGRGVKTLVHHARECGMSAPDIVKGVLALVNEALIEKR